ncbi:hypothetical protein HAX54_016197, partial [Datura stramonium]|nr:hypothetical protein [Datura stramonium]
GFHFHVPARRSYRLSIEISLLSRRRNRLPLNHPRKNARIKAFYQRAKAIAQERGFNPGKCDAVKEAADYVAGDVKDMPAASQLRFLPRLRRDLENGNSETWGLIEREVRRWRP